MSGLLIFLVLMFLIGGVILGAFLAETLKDGQND